MGIVKLITELKNACFYGEVLIKFNHGKIVLVQKTQTMKLDESEELYQQGKG